MKRVPHMHERLMIALLVGIMAVPMSSTALVMEQKGLRAPGTTDEEMQALSAIERAKLRADRRKAWNAVEEFQDASAVRWRAILREKKQDTQGTTQVTSVDTADLSEKDRALLKRYTRAKSCPESLKTFPVMGFYELCLSIVGSDASNLAPSGLLNHTAYVKRTLRGTASGDIPAFKLRLQMLKEALESGNRRDPGELPGRPTNCVNNESCQ